MNPSNREKRLQPLRVAPLGPGRYRSRSRNKLNLQQRRHIIFAVDCSNVARLDQRDSSMVCSKWLSREGSVVCVPARAPLPAETLAARKLGNGVKKAHHAPQLHRAPALPRLVPIATLPYPEPYP